MTKHDYRRDDIILAGIIILALFAGVIIGGIVSMWVLV